MEAVCETCKKTKRIYAHGVCRKCYMDEYNKRPYVVAKHAECERKRRAMGLAKVSEDRRKNSPKRVAWREKYNSSYYKRNRDKLIQYQRQYRRNKDNTSKQTTWKQRRRNRAAGVIATMTESDWITMLLEHNNSCFYCGSSGIPLYREHKTPLSRGGNFTPENIVPACRSCNTRKGAKTVEEYREYLIRIGESPCF